MIPLSNLQKLKEPGSYHHCNSYTSHYRSIPFLRRCGMVRKCLHAHECLRPTDLWKNLQVLLNEVCFSPRYRCLRIRISPLRFCSCKISLHFPNKSLTVFAEFNYFHLRASHSRPRFSWYSFRRIYDHVPRSSPAQTTYVFWYTRLRIRDCFSCWPSHGRCVHR